MTTVLYAVAALVAVNVALVVLLWAGRCRPVDRWERHHIALWEREMEEV